jgi:hypothetical protein
MPRCAFCVEAATLTGEHLWSDWIGQALGPRDYTFTRKNAEGVPHSWHGNKLDVKAKVVCERCNNGWMSDLETKTKPIVQDMILECAKTTLQSEQVELIAALSFKNAVVADHAHSNRLPFFTSSERRLFVRTLTIPGGIQMWLSSMSSQQGVFKSMYLQTPVGTPNGFELNAFTYGIGHLVIQVVTPRWKKKSLKRHSPPPRLTQAEEWNSLSIPFWPAIGSAVSWPSLVHLRDEDVDAFVQRWKNLAR